jgi:hypothetical protein
LLLGGGPANLERVRARRRNRFDSRRQRTPLLETKVSDILVEKIQNNGLKLTSPSHHNDSY